MDSLSCNRVFIDDHGRSTVVQNQYFTVHSSTDHKVPHSPVAWQTTCIQGMTVGGSKFTAIPSPLCFDLNRVEVVLKLFGFGISFGFYTRDLGVLQHLKALIVNAAELWTMHLSCLLCFIYRCSKFSNQIILLVNGAVKTTINDQVG